MAQRSYDRPPDMIISPGKDYYATFRTERGPIRVKLFADKAPETVNNFVFLAREGYFDGTTFHRVIKGGSKQDEICSPTCNHQTLGYGLPRGPLLGIPVNSGHLPLA